RGSCGARRGRGPQGGDGPLSGDRNPAAGRAQGGCRNLKFLPASGASGEELSGRGDAVLIAPGNQAAAITISGTRIVGASIPRRSSRSDPGSSEANMSMRLEAIVISATGSAISPPRTMKPTAPRL